MHVTSALATVPAGYCANRTGLSEPPDQRQIQSAAVMFVSVSSTFVRFRSTAMRVQS